MASPKLKFGLITAAAVILAVITGVILQQGSDTLGETQMFGWGFVFIASLLTAVRGFRYLMSLR